MFTRSAGQSYDHPLVRVADAEVRLDYGWYAHVGCDVHTSRLRIDPVPVPHLLRSEDALFATRSVQATWIVGQLEELEKLASTVKVIPVHKARFQERILDVAALRVAYQRGSAQVIERLLRCGHDFRTGSASYAKVFVLGLKLPVVGRRVLYRFPISEKVVACDY